MNWAGRACAILMFAGWLAPAVAGDGAREVDFNRDIRPLLSQKCFACHGPDGEQRQGELRLDDEGDAKRLRDGKAAIVPGKADASELVRRITSADKDERMPPPEANKTLTASEIDLLKRWIAAGAKWSLPWAYVPPRATPVPAVPDGGWSRDAIDRYIFARLEQAKLPPSAEADRTTLVRRLSIDLLGLPPTPDEVAEFVSDAAPDAYERLVDRLLAAPQFGERMAVPWLDWVRYADTVGYHGDQEHHISPYRDWVIAAFNRGQPFDQFTREQLAGDLLPGPTLEQRIATGYNRVLQTSHEGGVQPKEYLAIYAADHIRNLSSVWLGGTVGCAQCHDHKFDPYTTRDFYALAAFFADIDEAQHLTKGADRSPTQRFPELELPTLAQQAEIALLEEKIKALQPPSRKKPDAKQKSELAPLQKQLQAVKAQVRRTMVTVAIAPRVTRILPRGNWLDDSGEIVPPAAPQFLPKLEVAGRRATRLDLANWLVDPQQGLGGHTARVMVNRWWQLLLGAGLSRTLDDFGNQGEPPSHPELLDHLALEFVASGWDVKRSLRQIALSSVYRQVSHETPLLRERDPTQRLFARQSRFRYPAEAVRDSALRISGLLVERLGGPSARPYQPAGYYRHLNFPEREYAADRDAGQWRRGVYMHWQRQFLHPMLKAFDAPSREECTAQRPRSNTPLAALVLLNDPTFVEAARAFAERTLLAASDDDARVAFAFRWTVSREPTAAERQTLLDLLTTSRAHYRTHADDATKLLATGLRPANANLDRTELAAWTILARTLLARHETSTRP